MREELEKVDYSFPKMTKLKWPFAILVSFVLAFLLYFPAFSELENILKSTLGSNKSCPITYEKLAFDFFPPRVNISDLHIPGRCISSNIKDLTMTKLYLNFRGFSFTPFGPHFLIQTDLLKNKLDAYVTLGVGKAALRVPETSINLQSAELLTSAVKLRGKLKLSAYLEIEKEMISTLDVGLFSKDLIIPGQKLGPIQLKQLDQKNLLIKLTKSLSSKKLKVEKLIIGDKDAPIRANFSGPIKLNPNNIQSSKVDLKGELAFSKSFIESYSVVKFFMAQFDKKDEFYQIHIQGPIVSPKFSSPR